MKLWCYDLFFGTVLSNDFRDTNQMGISYGSFSKNYFLKYSGLSNKLWLYTKGGIGTADFDSCCSDSCCSDSYCSGYCCSDS